MKKKLLLCLTLILAFIALVGFGSSRIQEKILTFYYGEETEYAAGYNQVSWAKVKTSDSVEDVIRLLGVPLNKTKEDDGKLRFFYSAPGPQNKSYLVRLLVFDPHNKVEEIIEEIYLD